MKINKRLAFYHDFIDALVSRTEGVLGLWITKKGFPDLKENKKINEFLSRMTPADKKIIAQLVADGRHGGIHDTLVYLQQEIDCEDLKIYKNGVEIAIEPYGTTMYWDWSARCDGESWPTKDLAPEYKKRS